MKKIITAVAIAVSLSSIAQNEEWVELGNLDLVTNPGYQVIKFDKSGNCYYAYSDNNSPSTSLNVMKFDGTDWQQVGAPNITSGAFIRNKDIAFNDSGVPYVAMTDGANNLTVLTYTGTSWDTVGVANFAMTDGTNHKPKIQFDLATDQPVVAYRDLASNKLSVQRFDGTNWAYWNNGQNISEGSASLIDMTHLIGGPLYVGFANGDQGDSLSIYSSFNGASGWSVASADTVVSTGPILSLDMASDMAYPVVTYVNATDNQVYANRLSGSPLWYPFAGGSIGNADFYTDVAVGRSDFKTYIGFSDADELYGTTTKRIDDQEFLGGGAIQNADVTGFDGDTPYNIVFGNDQNDSILVAYGSLDIKVLKLRPFSDVGIQKNETDLFQIYPNPTSNIFSINFEDADTERIIEIISVDGKIVLQEKITKIQQDINVSNLVSGTYFVHVESENDRAIKKLIIQ